MNKIIKFGVLLIILNIGLSYSQSTDKDDCFKRLTDKYGKMNSISLKFSSPDMKNFEGTLIAERGNRYHINAKERVIVCNGETIWNYDIPENKLLISNYDNANANPLSIENFFFNFIENYAPSDLEESTSSLGTKSYILQLTPKSEKSYDIDDVKIWLDPKNYVIRSVKLKMGRKFQTLNIDDLVLNKKYPDKTFEYVPTGKEQVVDFR